MLSRIIYTSTISNDITPKEIEKILTKAQSNNDKKDITGMLYFSRNKFLQCLEGGRVSINETYHTILNDTRHSNIILLNYEEISQRVFSNWSMAYVPESSLSAPINLKYSNSTIFNPSEMSSESIYKMMLELKDVLTSVN
ncbi:BLUF domain-containing protein [Psychrosphaera aquimarina]|uniref:BLUF domain-containing protein n=1 Tax=Psychrosphaera aquimarina TaxID=2044854 RepID=A0ABU3QZ15_9GAMM|nr:BLUF domain-containing protein [Psychrosphaera aquimarina]MDU0112701.1 BLUF domain-containing protein [Psychrosphaera aquimarina]